MTDADPSPVARRRTWAWAAFVVVVAAALYWPATSVGFLADDVYQIALFEGHAGQRAPWALYSLYPLDPSGTAEHMARGSLPWWTVPEFRFVQVRPLSSLLLALDYTLAPRAALVHHLHSLAWLAAALVAAHLLLRRATSASIATLGLLLYAVDETFGWTVAWLANRCAMVSAAFAFGALALYLRSDQTHEPDRRRHRDLAQMGLWTLAFAAGEYALCGVAYAYAYALVGRTDPDPWRDRLRALWPATLPLLGFAVLSVALSAGVHGASSYVDPLSHPAEFIVACVDRIPRMLGEIWLCLPGETSRLLFRYEDSWLLAAIASLSEASGPAGVADGHGRFVLLCLGTAVATTGWLARRHLSEQERRTVAWTALGSTAALIPLAAILPSTRALALAALGPAVFWASVVVAAVRAVRARPPQWPSRVGAGLLVVVGGLSLYQHLWHDAAWARIQISGISSTARSYVHFHEGLTDADVDGRHVVVIEAPGLVTGLHSEWIMRLMGRPPPASWHTLSIGNRRLLLRRYDARTLELSTVARSMHDQPPELLFRSPPQRLEKDDQVDVGLFRATVVHDREGQGPASVQFVFDRSLDDPSISVLMGGPQGLVPAPLPAVGRAIAVPPPVLPGNARFGVR